MRLATATSSYISSLRSGAAANVRSICALISCVSGVSTATRRSYQRLVSAVLRDTFSGESSIGMPDRRTMRAASGSTQKLNSALGVTLPAPSGSAAIAPPMITMRFTADANAG